MIRLKTSHILPGLVWIGATTAHCADSVVRFTTNDQVPGTMESLTPELMVMQSPILEKPAPFFVKNLLDITLPGSFPEIKADHEAEVSLTNGDIVRGQLSSVTDEAVILDTPFAGRMEFKRLNVKDLAIHPVNDSIYRGPSGMEGWKTQDDKPAWKYANSSFLSIGEGAIGKEGILPDECSIAFDIAWKGGYFAFKLITFSKDVTQNSGSSGYEITFQRNGYFVRNLKGRGIIGDGQAQELQENEKVHINFRASRKTGKLCLFINNRITNVWEDPELKKAVFGDGFQFVSMGALPLRISRIEISNWDGTAEQAPDPQVGMGMGMGMGMGRLGGIRWGAGGIPELEPKPKPEKDTTQGRMELANGDSIEGEPTSIKNSIISIKTPLGDVKLPVARLRTINLKKADLEMAIRRKGDVRTWFPDGSSLVFELKSVNGNLLTGASQNFGTADFKIDTISRIDFNIYDLKLQGRHATTDW